MTDRDRVPTAVDAIRRVVETVRHAQQNELVDGVATTAHGRRLVERAAIAEFTRQVLPPPEGSPLSVMAREGDERKLVATQNTIVLPPD